MKKTLENDVLDDLEKSLSVRGLSLSDFTITILEELKSAGNLAAEGVIFRIAHKASGKYADYVEGHANDIRDTLCKDILRGAFPNSAQQVAPVGVFASVLGAWLK